MPSAPKFNTLAFISVMLVGCGLSLFWALGQPRLYETVQQIQSVNLEDAKIAKSLITSEKMSERVVSRMSADDKVLLVELSGRGGDGVSIERLISRNLRVETDLHELMTSIRYRSADPQLAVRISKLSLSAAIARAARHEIDEDTQDIEAFVRTMETQRIKTTDAQNALAAYQRAYPDVNDETYQALVAAAQSEESIYAQQVAHIRKVGIHTGPRISRYGAFPDKRSPSELPYLRWPIVRNVAWGCLNTLLVAAVLATPFVDNKARTSLI
ncbi:MAG: hypothetical protein ABII82_07060 [Verrucomicrobiota bacterium]